MSAQKEVFTQIYDQKLWVLPSRDTYTADGPASTEYYTQSLRSQLVPFLKKWKVKSMLDASCGEYNWMRLVDLGNIKYIGGDIVAEKINILKKEFPNKEWLELDIINDPLPKADLWMCRDTLFHFPIDAVKKTFQNFLKSDIKYILTTSHPSHSYNKNEDIVHFGGWFGINLFMEPFNFPQPLDIIDDSHPQFPDKKLFLYKRTDLKKVKYLQEK